MVYFLGRDVKVYITTESKTADETIGVSGNKCIAGTDVTAANMFAQDMESSTATDYTQVADLTGVDVSVGATDEDITYVGQKGANKVEIKKECTVSLTRKQSNNVWEIIFNGPTNATFLTSYSTEQKFGARWGLDGNGAMLGDGMVNPKDVVDAGDVSENEFGYRVHIVFKSGTELIALPNCTLTSYSTSLNADGTTEETMEFTTQQSIVQSSDGTALNNEQTTKVAF